MGLCIILLSCEKTYNNLYKITGTWQLSLEMYNNALLINEINGKLIFYADHTAKLLLNDNGEEAPIEYQWYEQPDHLVLINQSSNFPLPYYIVSQSNNYIELSQTDDVKMKLFR